MHQNPAVAVLLAAPATVAAQRAAPTQVDIRTLGWPFRSDGNQDLSGLTVVAAK